MECSNNEGKIVNSSNKYYYRFDTILSLLRLAGIQLKTKSTTKLTMVYNVTIIVCYYITILCLCMDAFVRRNDLVECMKKIRLIYPNGIVMWIHFSLR
jgi:hypothetical protein